MERLDKTRAGFCTSCFKWAGFPFRPFGSETWACKQEKKKKHVKLHIVTSDLGLLHLWIYIRSVDVSALKQTTGRIFSDTVSRATLKIQIVALRSPRFFLLRLKMLIVSFCPANFTQSIMNTLVLFNTSWFYLTFPEHYNRPNLPSSCYIPLKICPGSNPN